MIEKSRSSSTTRFSEGIESLLADHVRPLFRADETALQSIGRRSDDVRKDAQLAASKLQQHANFRLSRLQELLEQTVIEGEQIAASVRQLTDERDALRSLLEKGLAHQWSETEIATAKAHADGALTDAAKEIEERKGQIDVLQKRNDELALEQQAIATSKSDSEALFSSLTAGLEPQPYRDALAQEIDAREIQFRIISQELQRSLAEQRDFRSAAEGQVAQLKKDLNTARAHAAQLASAKGFGRLALHLTNLFSRSEDEIARDLKAEQDRLSAAKKKIAGLGLQLAEHRRGHEEQLASLPNAVRQKLADNALQESNEAAAHLSEIKRMSAEISTNLTAQLAEISAREARYDDEQRQLADAYFEVMLKEAQQSREGIEASIATTSAQHLRVRRRQERLQYLLEKRRAGLNEDLLACSRQETAQLESLDGEARRWRVRLQDRAPRAGMVYDPTTSSFREKETVESPTQLGHMVYRRTSEAPRTLASLPVLLQRRLQTGYVSRDDTRLASALASHFEAEEPTEEERAHFIDNFCDKFFGDDEEERAFFVSVVSEEKMGTFALFRPAKVLPQLKSALPGAMSICVLCRLAYDEERTPGNTTLYPLDVALVPDCEPRPFERAIALIRHTSRNRLPAAAHPLEKLLGQAASPAPVLLTQLEDRLRDWEGYLDWADEQILRRSPSAMLGPGEWKDRTWEGFVFCETKQVAHMLTSVPKFAGSQPRMELFRWDAHERLGNSVSSFRCDSVEIINENPTIDISRHCPWPNGAARSVRIVLRARDAAVLGELPEDASFGLRNMSEAAGARTQITRYRDALRQLQALAPGGKQRSRLAAAPYLMASIFNVSQASRPMEKSGRFLNGDISDLYRLNEDQGRAVEVMLAAPEIAYIQGPPGTGKTTMIAAACAHFVRSGKRVLIASQTNLAVENALERLIEDPEARPLWLSRIDGDKKKSSAIGDWYRLAADHVEAAVRDPFLSLADDVEQWQIWLERARKLDRDRGVIGSDLQCRERELCEAQAQLNELLLRQEREFESDARGKWWAMAHDALAYASGWDASLFSPALAPEAADLLKILAAHDGSAPRLDVSPGALNRQVQEKVRALQPQVNSENSHRAAEILQMRSAILADWPDLPSPSRPDPEAQEANSVTTAQAETQVRRAQQSLGDAQERANAVGEKVENLLSEIEGFLIQSQIPSELSAAVDAVRHHADLQAVRLNDVDPLRAWLPLLDQWAQDAKKQAENPSSTDRMGERYIRHANVIGITCNSDFSVLSDAGFSRFDVVIIDEVSKATPLELLRPMLLAPKTILVGDHRQLPPTFDFASVGQSEKSPTEDEDFEALEREAELLRKYERLTTASLFRDGFAEIDSKSRAALHTQYRMHPQIMALVNRFYDGRLESGLVDPDGLDETAKWSWRTHGLTLNSRTGGHYLSPHQHALWVDSSEDDAGKPAYEDSESGGIGNQLEARLVAQLVADIVDACAREQRKKTIAVATFYNRQKRLIQASLREKLGPRFQEQRIDVETVDRFQGKEADIVIVSMVRNRSPQKGRLGRNSNPAKFERINVAFSRARDLLMVVGARETFERFEVAIEPVDGGTPQRTRVYGQIIDDIRDAGGLWRAQDILGPRARRSGDRPA
ncbi:AAA domain-containing protein [Sphingomonas sp. HH69]